MIYSKFGKPEPWGPSWWIQLRLLFVKPRYSEGPGIIQLWKSLGGTQYLLKEHNFQAPHPWPWWAIKGLRHADKDWETHGLRKLRFPDGSHKVNIKTGEEEFPRRDIRFKNGSTMSIGGKVDLKGDTPY